MYLPNYLIPILLGLTTTVRAQDKLWMPTTPSPETTPGTFMLVAPKSIRPDRPYSVSVNIMNARDDEQHVVRIEIMNARNDSIALKVVPNVQKGAPQTVTIDQISADKLVPGEYKLFAKMETLGGQILFEASETLSFDAKSSSIFVQTDKAAYKPGSQVRLRALVIKPDLLPYQGKVNVYVHDPSDNLIQQWIDQPLNKGVTSQSLELSDDPPLGDWRIKVRTDNGMQYQKTFSVEKYVLPKFEVTIEPPGFVTNRDDVQVLVKAKYTYGKGVQGPVKLVVEPEYPFWMMPEPPRLFPVVENIDSNSPTTAVEKRLELTEQLNNMGEYKFIISNAELLRRQLLDREGRGEQKLKFTATATEKLTGIAREATETLTAYDVDAKLELQKSTETYKPGLPYKVVLSLTRPDDSPATADMPKQVKLVEVFNYPAVGRAEQRSDEKSRIVDVGEDGEIVLTVEPPVGTSNIRIEAMYDRLGNERFDETNVRASVYVDAGKSPTDSFVMVESTVDGVKAGQTVRFNIKATDDLQFVTAQVMSRGDMVLSQDVQLANQAGSIQFTTTEDMAPKSRIIVYGIRDGNNEILVDALDFKVDGLFKNKVSVSMSRDQAKPGEAVSVRVKADPDSLVCLLAVDESVLLFKSGNDITQELVGLSLLDIVVYVFEISSDIDGYSTITSGGGPGGPFMPWRGVPFRAKRSIWSPWWGVGGKDAKSVFKNAGLVVLTDAYLYSEPEPPHIHERFEEIMLAAPAFNVNEEADDDLMMIKKVERVDQSRIIRYRPTAGHRIRTEFPETWLWTEVTGESADGQLVYEATVPDTITSWITSAFAISDDSGLGVAPETAKIKVFRPFFVQLNLPYSIKRGEQLALQVLVFNYEAQDQWVELELAHDSTSGFDFVEQDGKKLDLASPKLDKNYNKRQTKVPANGGSTSVFFPIVANVIGDVKLRVTAKGSTESDGVERDLLVEPEGFRVDKNHAVVVDLSDQNSFTQSVPLVFPPEYVSGSESAEVNVAGDLMGPVMSNLEKLVTLPVGCGEQNMVTLVPNIVVVNYLTATQRTEPTITNKALSHMKRGYQRELNYKHQDGSFSAFGESDDSGSTWLTAFVLRSFKQSQAHIFVDPDVIKSGIEYLQRVQNEKGEFVEHGTVHHQDMQGGASEGGVPLTAYVTLTMLENKVADPQAIKYLEDSLQSITDEPYALAVTAYALQLAGSPKKDDAWNLLFTKAQQTDGQMFWSDAVDEEKPEDQYYWSGPRSVDVEMTSYALLTMLQRGQVSEALPIVKWLSAKRNPNGGWSSTQDTVVALTALAAFAEKAYSPTFDVTLNVKNGDNKHSFKIDGSNALLWQNYEVKDLQSPVELSAEGSGVVFAQVHWKYHLTKLRDDVPFQCQQNVLQLQGSSDITLNVCCNHAKAGKTKSNMAVLEVNALSGYSVDLEQLNTLTNIKHLQRVETEKSDSKANIYFNELTGEPTCVNITTQMTYQVSDQKDASMVLYDYYENKDRVEMKYSARQKRSLQSVCDDCWSNLIDPEVRQQSAAAANSTCADNDEYSHTCSQWRDAGLCDGNSTLAREDMRLHERVLANCQQTCALCLLDDEGDETSSGSGDMDDGDATLLAFLL